MDSPRIFREALGIKGSAVKASTLSFYSAVCLGIVGMVVGIIMAASGDHRIFPAHAHLDLLGWVSLFLIGIFYRLHPSIGASRVALVQVGIWICATVILSCGVAAIFLGRPDLEFIAIAGSLIILADMVMFAYLIFRSEQSASRTLGAAIPAE